MNVDLLLSRLDKVKPSGRDRWSACCPAHADKTPSLTVTQKDDRVLIHCFGGCGAADVLAAVGLDFSVLMPDEEYKPMFRSKRREEQVSDDEWLIKIFKDAVRNRENVTAEDQQRYLEAVNRVHRRRVA